MGKTLEVKVRVVCALVCSVWKGTSREGNPGCFAGLANRGRGLGVRGQFIA